MVANAPSLRTKLGVLVAVVIVSQLVVVIDVVKRNRWREATTSYKFLLGSNNNNKNKQLQKHDDMSSRPTTSTTTDDTMIESNNVASSSSENTLYDDADAALKKATTRTSTKTKSEDTVPSSRSSEDINNGSAASSHSHLSRESRKPQLILHIGPIKTATSTVQRELLFFEEALSSDGYIYSGKGRDCVPKRAHVVFNDTRETLHTHILEAMTQDDIQSWRVVKNQLDLFCTTGQNIIVSNEALFNVSHNLNSPHLKKALGNWDILVVATYRRLSGWFPSQWNQSYKSSGPRFRNNFRTRDNGSWECMEIPSLNQFLILEIGALRNITTRSGPSLIAWPSIPNRTGFQFATMNFEVDDMTKTFLCEILSGAKTACKALLGSGRNRIANPSSSMDYAVIACAAAREGVVDSSRISFQDLKAQIETHHTEELVSRALPLVCPEQSTLEELYALSMQFERSVVPHFYYGSDESTRSQQFWNLVDEKKFCSVDTAAVFEHEAWASFWKSQLNS